MSAYDPWLGEQNPHAWCAALVEVRAREWLAHSVLLDVMVSASGIKEHSAQDLLSRAVKYGVLIRTGEYDRKTKTDHREYRLVPMELHYQPASLNWYRAERAPQARSAALVSKRPKDVSKHVSKDASADLPAPAPRKPAYWEARGVAPNFGCEAPGCEEKAGKRVYNLNAPAQKGVYACAKHAAALVATNVEENE